MTDTKLKPCPFCGSSAKLTRFNTPNCGSGFYTDKPHHYAVVCTDARCGIQMDCGLFDEYLNDAVPKVEAWNRRALSARASAGEGGEWSLVPRKPTTGMLEAAGTINGWSGDDFAADDDHVEWWDRMIGEVPEVVSDLRKLAKEDGWIVCDVAADMLERLTTRPTPEAQEARDAANGNHGLDTDEMVRFYERDFYVLSNFSSFRLTWRGIDFDTSEAAYHWEKFDGTAPEVQDMIREARSAHDAFKLAESQKVFRREDWDSVKLDVMRRILRAKADQHEYVRRKLLATGDRLLVEDSWRDDFWGWGPKRDGQNWLGRLWMEVRAALALPAQGEGK